jgi:hypothetical protein
MHAGTMTWEHRAGVCKDKAGMLVTLLRAAGFAAYPAMTMAGSRVERIAADQFNHAVVAWRQPDGSFRMVDPTWAPYSRDIWSRAETEQQYLIGTAEGEDLATTPAEGPERNGMVVRAEGRLDADGNLESTVRLEPFGWIEDRARRLLARSSALETDHLVEEVAARLAPTATVRSFRFLEPLDLDHQFSLEFSYRAESHAAAGPALLRLVPPLARHPFGPGRLGDYLQAVGGEERRTPVFLRSAQTVTAEERIALPAGFDLAAPIDRYADSAVASFEGHVAQEGRALVVRSRTVIRKRNISPGEYPGLADAVEVARAFAGTAVILERAERREGGAP